MNNFIKFIENKQKNNEIVIFDGGFGTEVLKRGIDLSNKCPESLNITNPDVVYEIHKAYIDAGADVITTNTFGCNRHKLKNYNEVGNLKNYAKAGIKIAKQVAKKSDRKIFVVATIGAIGALVEPIGNMSFDETYSIYKEVIEIFDEAKPDAIILETMIDLQEARIAMLACNDTTKIPVIVSMTYENGVRTTTGTPPEVASAVFERLGASVIGANCSVGPKQMVDVVKKIKSATSLPVIIQANAGMPVIKYGKTCFPLPACEYSKEVVELVDNGACIIGGCCGTTPEHILRVKEEINVEQQEFPADNCEAIIRQNGQQQIPSFLASRTKLLRIEDYPFMIGERINPNAQKKIAESIRNGEFSVILQEAQEQVEQGADVLDVNVSVVNTDEPKNMKKIVSDISGIVDAAICIDSPDYRAIEEGLKIFAGKALVNSINGEKERLDKILPLVKKYGASVIALTMDDKGIPDSVEGRLEIAKKIIKECDKYKIPRQDIYFDTLVLTISTNPLGAKITLDTIREIKKQFGTRTALGLSNISFGLPGRNVINSNFLAMAIEAGLDGAITNPKNELLRNTFYSASLLCGKDDGAKKYIDAFFEMDKTELKQNSDTEIDMKQAIIRGLKDLAVAKVKDEMKNKKLLEIINQIVIPALDVVGAKYEKGEYFLPQLLLSAESAKAVSNILMDGGEKNIDENKTIVFATVRGDLHDIGKNIVISVLENYGYNVIDLGKSIDAKMIVDSAVKYNAKAIALSALMTTTMQEMVAVMEELKNRGIRQKFKVLVGGAVLNQEYADSIGADAYSKDAMATVVSLKRLGI